MPIRGSPNGANHLRPQAGRDRLEQVVAINWNAWSQSIGTAGRNHPVRACVLANFPQRNAIHRYALADQVDKSSVVRVPRAPRRLFSGHDEAPSSSSSHLICFSGNCARPLS